ncbi:MAG TPA: DUF835 domain-containing protein [Thermoplasmata archaeon]|nr:DUF835 domain-containing protein [Thermoplasmata archaeon]
MSNYSPGATPSFEPQAGNAYLVEERRPRLSYELLEASLGSGFSGLVVTRELPKKLQSERDLDGCRILWMTNMVGDGRINPTAIGILMSQIRGFIEGNPKSAVLIDGLEYLISLNTYDRMLQFMHQLRDLVITSDSVLLVPFDPRTVSERELALLERNLETIIPRAEVDMPENPILDTSGGEIRLLNAGHR